MCFSLSNGRYPTCIIVTKYAFPKDPLVDHIYRHFISEGGKKYSRLNKIQTRIAALAFALPTARLIVENAASLEELSMSLDFVCRDRGKVIMRSDWTENATWFNFDARSDGFLIGHDTCSRGAFVLNADGRRWASCPEWSLFKDTSDFSIPSIDGLGQKDKAPFVRLLDVSVGGPCGSTFASADLTYAYNWTWTSWAKEGQDYSKEGFEVEPNDPRDFGFNVWWSPCKIYGENDVGFVGLYQWRKRIATIEKVMRSSLFVRASRPYVLLADEVKKDGEVHVYSWAMTIPTDVFLESFDGRDAILAEDGNPGRRFLVRAFGNNDPPLSCSFREITKWNKKTRKNDKAHQVVFSCEKTEASFKFMLISLPRAESIPPETKWIEEGTILEVRDANTGTAQQILFSVGSNTETVMKVVE